MNMEDDHSIMKVIRARAQSRAADADADADAVSQTSDDNAYDKQSPSPSDLRRFIDDMRTAPNPAFAAEQRRKQREKLEEIAGQLNAGKHVQNRTLETWLDPADYAEIDARWQQQKRMRAGSKDKPDALKEYEARLKRAQFFDGKAQGERKQGKLNAAEVSLAACNDELDALMDYAREQIEADADFADWLDRPLPRSDLTPTLEAMPRSITSSSKDVRVKRQSIAEIKQEVVSEAIEKLKREG